MFRFRELSLFNWDYWPPIRIPLDRDVVLFIGPNGSGKTTLLDAIRQILNAPRLSSRRRLQHYLRRPAAPALLRAVVSNEEVRGAGRPFRRERIVAPEVTLACALVPSPGGTPEKRFAVLPGRPSVEEIRACLLESRDFYGPDRYQRILEQAGVTRSLMSVLALEQGRTNSLFELSTRELLQRVLDMMGDRTVLERYREARRRYEESDREVFRQTHDLQRAQLELTRVQREVERLAMWERAWDKVQELEARLPAAQLQEILRRRADAAQKMPELRTKIRNDEAEVDRLEREAGDAKAEAGKAELDLVAARRVDRDAAGAFQRAAEEHGAAGAEVENLDRDERVLATLRACDLEALVLSEAEAARNRYRLEGDAARATEAVRTAADRLQALENGKPAHPDTVDKTLHAFAERGIPGTLLAGAVEVDADAAAAAEAALADSRWTIAVPEEHEAEAISLASEHGFPGPVWGGEQVRVAERVGPLNLQQGAPAWLLGWAASVLIAADGSWRDERGAWAARAVTPVLGERAREAALGEARRRSEEMTAAASEIRVAFEQAVKAHGDAVVARDDERRRLEMMERVAGMAEARGWLVAAKERLAQAQAVHEEKKAEVVALSLALERAQGDAGRAEREREIAVQRLEGERKALGEMEDKVRHADDEILELTPRVSAELRLRAERGDLDGADTVRSDLDRARRALEEMGDKPEEAVREEARHLEINVQEAERHVQARTQEASSARDELLACRRRYLDVVDAALQDYRRRAIQIARGAGVAVEMELPKLANDDRALDEAELLARFGFDGKDPLPLGDSSFSGGQQVIGGLILLMAMVEGEGRGFFMLDEPFAHLSIDRIDDVGRFLRLSGAQFLITAPTTLDRAQLDPASLVVMLRKKRSDDPHAPVPVVAEA